MGWLDRLIIEMTQICREALGSWSRTGQLCLLIFSIAAGLSLLLWVSWCREGRGRMRRSPATGCRRWCGAPRAQKSLLPTAAASWPSVVRRSAH
jgi:hypothetical protein